MSQIITELNLSTPVSINHAYILALANKTGLPISFSDLLGETARFDGSRTVQQAGQFNYFVDLSGNAFFDVSFNSAGETNAAAYLQVTTTSAPSKFTGNIIAINNTLGRSLVLSYVGGGVWGGSSGGGAGGIGLSFNAGQTYSLTIKPHS